MKTAFYAAIALGFTCYDATAQSRPAAPAGLTALQARLQGGFSLLAQPRAVAARGAGTVLRPGQKVAYGFDAATSRWTDPIRVSFGYDAQGLTTQETAADSASGASLYRTLTTYNAAQHPLSVTHQYSLGGTWANGDRRLYTYDAQQRLVLEEHQLFSAAGTWQTDEATRYQFVYNAARHPTEETIQVFRPATQTYADSVRYQYTVAATGEWTSRVSQLPDGQGGWENDERLANVTWHNFAQGMMSSADIQVFNLLQQWNTVGKHTGTYSPTRWELLSQHLDNGTLVNVARQSLAFDFAGNPAAIVLEEWNGTWQTVIAIGYQYVYNPDATMRTRITSFDLGGAGLEPAERENFSGYQPITLASRGATRLAAPLLAYPNPSPDGRLTLELPAAAATAQLTVTDALGREVLRDAWTNAPRPRYELRLAGQPAGLYTVRLQTPAGYATQKISLR